MRILISGGGTGGHIYPAIAIAEQLKENNSNNEILFVGSKGKMEIQKVRDSGFPIVGVWMDGINRKNIFKNFLLPFKMLYSYWKVRKVIKYFKPDIVIGTGGYVTWPVISVSHNFKIPTVILEQNAIPGLTNRLLGKKVTKVILAYDNASKYFSKEKVHVLGNPVRNDITLSRITKKRAKEYFGFQSSKKCILVLGGSLGARTLNRSIEKNYKKILDADIQILWQTGKKYYSKIIKKLPQQVAHLVLPIDFIEDIRIAYAAADVVIARGGALTISELAIKKKPTIFVPSPNVANDHQTKNVLALVEKDAAMYIRDKDAIKFLLDDAIYLSNDVKTKKILSKNIYNFAYKNASVNICKVIEEVPYDILNITTASIIKRYKYVYFLGIGGLGMSSLARYFLKLKMRVLGYDKYSTILTTQLKEEGISIGFEDGIRFIPREVIDNPNKTLVIYTPAIPKDNEILNHMLDKGVATYKRSTILGRISNENFTIAVGGTHGKTTTSAIISHILMNSKQLVKSFFGGILQQYNSNFLSNEKGIENKNTVCVIEADEYDKSFLKLSPNIEILTSVDLDHMDVYKNKQGVLDGFNNFVNLLPNDGKLIIQKSAIDSIDKNLYEQIRQNIICYGLTDSDHFASNIRVRDSYTIFDYRSIGGKTMQNIKIPIHGTHNVENAIAAIIACRNIGIQDNVIKLGLETFPGIKRRFEYIIKTNRHIFINDYAHHPTEITSVLQSIRDIYPTKKITVVFQPHLYSRTRDFAKEFAKSLAIADKIYLMPIYGAREKPIDGISSKVIFTKIRGYKGKKILCEKEELCDKILQDEVPELLVTMGAGDIDILVPLISEKIFKTKM